MSDDTQKANVESYIERLRKPCGVPPAIQREVAYILESMLAKLSNRPPSENSNG